MLEHLGKETTGFLLSHFRDRPSLSACITEETGKLLQSFSQAQYKDLVLSQSRPRRLKLGYNVSHPKSQALSESMLYLLPVTVRFSGCLLRALVTFPIAATEHLTKATEGRMGLIQPVA